MNPRHLMFLSCGLLLTAMTVHTAPAQEIGSAKPTGPALKVGTSAPVGKANRQGLKVHGHWSIELKDKDGKVVDRRDFENALVTTPGVLSSGSQILAAVLSGDAAVGDPGIAFITKQNSGSDVTLPCSYLLAATYSTRTYNPVDTPCFIATTPNSLWNFAPVASGFIGLGANSAVSVGSPTMLTPNITISGTFAVPADATIYSVQSLYGICVPYSAPYSFNGDTPPPLTGSAPFRQADIASSGCTNTAVYPAVATESAVLGTLTAHTLATPMPVTVGQTIAFVVTLTFS